MAILDLRKPEPGSGDPVIITVSASELSDRAGQLRREVDLQAHIRIVDLKQGRTVGWLTASPRALADFLDRTEGTAND